MSKSKAAPARRILSTDTEYPAHLASTMGSHAPPELFAIGAMKLLTGPTLALVCSSRCPGSIILATHIFATRTPRSGPVIIGGFHSPMERQCLDLLIRRRVPAVVCPARSIEKIRLPLAWRNAVSMEHLLILAPFAPGHKRATTRQAVIRNEFAGALAERVLIPHARPGSKTEHLVRRLLEAGKRVLTFHDRKNEHLLQLGVQPFDGLLQPNEGIPPEATGAWFGV